MHIDCRYPEKITWVLDLTTIKDALELFGKKTQKKLKSSINRLKTTDYTFKIDQVDENFIKIFYPIYSKNVKQKKNPLVHDLMDKVILNPPHHFPYFAVSLYREKKLQGAVIFSDRGDFIVTAFRTFPLKIEISLPITVSYIAEYYLNAFALENGKKFIQRGSDRNLFGTNASLGLVNFKLLCAYEPHMMLKNEFEKKNYKITKGYTWDEKENVLIFEASEFGKKIHHAILLINPEKEAGIEEKYKTILNSTNLEVTTIYKKP